MGPSIRWDSGLPVHAASGAVPLLSRGGSRPPPPPAAPRPPRRVPCRTQSTAKTRRPASEEWGLLRQGPVLSQQHARISCHMARREAEKVQSDRCVTMKAVAKVRNVQPWVPHAPAGRALPRWLCRKARPPPATPAPRPRARARQQPTAASSPPACGGRKVRRGLRYGTTKGLHQPSTQMMMCTGLG